MEHKLNKAILILYNLCGISLFVVLGKAGMTPPVGYVPPGLLVIGSIPFVALIAAHVALKIVKRKAKKVSKN